MVVCAIIAASACAPAPRVASGPRLYVFRHSPPALLELSRSLHAVRELPFSIPTGCALSSIHAARRGSRLAVELHCGFGSAVLLLDTDTGAVRQPITDSDSHFLSWTADGRALYMRVDSINRPRVVRIGADGSAEPVTISELTYDLAASPIADEFVFSFSRGMGLGSELWLAGGSGNPATQLILDPANYLSLARWSPDGTRLAFIKIPDSATPFTVGELWVMEPNGREPRRLASADAGHGFAAAWSPNGDRIAFVARENGDDHAADVDSSALVSNLQVVNLENGESASITNFRGGRVEAPMWHPDEDVIVFSARLNDRMAVYIADLIADTVKPIEIEGICCGTWLRE